MSVKILEENINDFSFFRCASFSLPIKIADVEGNKELLLKAVRETSELSCNLVMFQPLVLTSSSCTSLFFDSFLLEKSLDAIFQIARETQGASKLICVGFPFQHEGSLYNGIAVMCRGKILCINALPPPSHIQNVFAHYEDFHKKIPLFAEEILFASDIILNVSLKKNKSVKIAFCGESNYNGSYKKGAQLYCIFSSESVHLGKRKNILERCKTFSHSSFLNHSTNYSSTPISNRSCNAIVFSSPSSTENYGVSIYNNLTCIIEGGEVLSSCDVIDTMQGNSRNGFASCSYADIDVELLANVSKGEKCDGKSNNFEGLQTEVKICLFPPNNNDNDGKGCNSRDVAPFSSLARPLTKSPFISFAPASKQEIDDYIEEVFDLQSLAIKEKLTSIGIKNVVIGVSGGIDSSIALLFLIRAFRMYRMDVQNIHAFTLPCFGTTEGTKTIALNLCKLLGCRIEEINIKESVLRHFADIKQDASCYDVTFENAQARERTQVLMDKANQLNALVIGSSDLSEIALGFSTFSGDHISMYNLLASLPKTTLRLCLEYATKNSQLFLENRQTKDSLNPTIETQSKKKAEFVSCLSSILQMPISPELLPHKDGKITQKTEEILGSYALQDFFIYHVCKNHYSPKKTYALSLLTFPEYRREEILERLKLFYKRFFASQFKRNCSPESPNITGHALSTWEMPSNALARMYIEELEKITEKA